MHWILIICAFGAPNAGRVCVESKPIATLQECEALSDALNITASKSCVSKP
jgi:hypothetical protein